MPLLEDLKAWLEKVKARSLPKSGLMEAVNYTLNQWNALCRPHHQRQLGYRQQQGGAGGEALRDRGRTCLLFVSDRGGKALAILTGFTETCKKFGINPWQYLKDTLDRLPVTSREDLHFLPPSCQPVHQPA